MAKVGKDKDKETILIVDDVETNRVILEEIIKDMGGFPVLAESGEEALVKVGECDPQLILSDISMPGMDGYELCRILKNDEKTKNIPIVFISALMPRRILSRVFPWGEKTILRNPLFLKLLRQGWAFI